MDRTDPTTDVPCSTTCRYYTRIFHRLAWTLLQIGTCLKGLNRRWIEKRTLGVGEGANAVSGPA